MFTDRAQTIVELAKDYAFSNGSAQLNVRAVLAAMGQHPEASVLLAECLNIAVEKLRDACPAFGSPAAYLEKLPLDETARSLLACARKLAQDVPDGTHPGLIDVRHLVGAVANADEACAILDVRPLSLDAVSARLSSWLERENQTPRLDELTDRLRRLRMRLLAKVFGQDHAVQAFVEALFNAEVVAAADRQRKRPRALFVFAGPPGVGKTLLAELGASHLDRPFKRFDMSGFAGYQQDEALVGISRSYRGAHPGQLTEFVEKNSQAVLLFDEIEKAHPKTIQLFLQILDAGTLEDKFHERNVAFRDTTIIFTTNAGRKLYDRPNASGVHGANAAFHRRTILDALENEEDPRTGEPFFPAAICSRMATGYPVLFNHLRINELERVVGAELRRVAGLLELQYYKRVVFDELVPLCLVLREGARADARTLCSQAEIFLKTELFKFCQLFRTDRLEDAFQQVDHIEFVLDKFGCRRSAGAGCGASADASGGRSPDRATPAGHRSPGAAGDLRPDVGGVERPAPNRGITVPSTDVRALLEPEQPPRVLLIAAQELAGLYRKTIPEVQWQSAHTADDALELLGDQELDIVLLDLWMGGSQREPTMTMRHFDHAPAAARGLEQGQELLRKVRERIPDMPVYLLSLAKSGGEGDDEGSIDEELFLACVRGGGARGMIVTGFVDGTAKGWQSQRNQLSARLLEAGRRLSREKAADRLGRERKALSFDTAPCIDPEDRTLSIRLRNLRLTRAIAAADAGEVLEDVERPRTRFDDVIGADGAKEEVKFFIDYLKNPRRFAALGLKPPKGVLLHGPPGTGKTMLARAMAGESDVAFLSASASSFVTIWQLHFRQSSSEGK